TQQRAIRQLTGLLAPEGLLLVGSSETGVFMDQDFTSANMPKAFAFRRRTDRRPSEVGRPAAVASTGVRQPMVARANTRMVQPAQPKFRSTTSSTESRAVSRAPEPPATMEKAYRL